MIISEKHKRALLINFEIQSLMLFAGVCAEARFRHQSINAMVLSGGLGDISRFSDIGRTYYKSDEELIACERRVVFRVKSMFREPGIWDATLKLANRLHDKRRLDGAEVLSIIKNVTGEGKRRHNHLFPSDF